MHSRTNNPPTGRTALVDPDSENEFVRPKSASMGKSASMYSLLNAIHSGIDNVPTGRVVFADPDSENEFVRPKSTAMGKSASTYHTAECNALND